MCAAFDRSRGPLFFFVLKLLLIGWRVKPTRGQQLEVAMVIDRASLRSLDFLISAEASVWVVVFLLHGRRIVDKALQSLG